ncbi:tRNA lysidine(34) synthetase TilS [Vibrio coralliirubri]|uniref:tRNA lysidine(34) synthetase TilS n=1 Tax=Vibrio coralliirubri TaxID=1516159 RepID=UPI002284FD82|nr:tRNA lysidine(34) synthetase TilS [Vibrio coralliirubri]MCY9861095.1 tRNA lysidine(34) synthetase TilS [Vibrio coralliirubri]
MNLISKEQATQMLVGKKLVVGLSGGIDSIALLHCVSQLPDCEVRAIHVNHGISHKADEWQGFCEQVCQSLNIAFEALEVSFDTNKNLEANARTARYTAIKNNLGDDEYLLTGHHLDDQAETILLALKRGTGLDGLCGMAPLSYVHGINICRPLLNNSREEIESYAAQKKLSWIEDESNTDTSYDRNFLRHEVLPLLNKRWSGFSKNVARTAEVCRSTKEVTSQFTAEHILELTQQGFISNDLLKGKPTSYQFFVMREWFRSLGIKAQSHARMKEIERTIINSRFDALPRIELQKNTWLTRVKNRIEISR